jgi:threonylcarbamoyladenosine tRNA methylthiotransferase MtaB
MPTVSFRTFGCKLNQAETDLLAGEFRRRGYDVVDSSGPSDVAVIHTCTVTGRSDAKCRQAVRHALRLNPGATVVLAGCYPQVAADALAAIPGVDYVYGTLDKFSLFGSFEGPGKLVRARVAVSPLPGGRADREGGGARPGDRDRDPEGGDVRDPRGGFAPPSPGSGGGRTRAYLKIHSGCDRNCSYCIVPRARGAGRSEDPVRVLEAARALADRGFREIVVTGTHIGDYGRDRDSGLRLPGLLDRLLRVPGLDRIRLSSLDPDEFSDALLDAVSADPRICRHFHVSLQSGSDRVLRAMRRPYDTARFRRITEDLTRRFGVFGLGTDVIAGFPGETEAEFGETLRFVESLPFSYLHVFPFSARPGTDAAALPDSVDPGVRLERARRLRAVGAAKRRAFAESWVGRTAEVLFEAEERPKILCGFTPEYLRVEAPADPALANRIRRVRISEALEDAVRGEVLGDG